MKMFKEDGLGSVTPGHSAKKELVLPDIMPPQTTLQPLSSTTNTSHNRGYVPTAAGQPVNGLAPKISLHATGGAGFSSNATYTGPLLKA